jgi:hypothetical protein
MPKRVSITMSPFDQHALKVDNHTVSRGASGCNITVELSTGKHTIDWQGTGTPSGEYTLTFTSAKPTKIERGFLNDGRGAGTCTIEVE